MFTLLFIRVVEEGKNPDIFTQAFVERTATENQFTNGKIKAVSVSDNLIRDHGNC
jgi:hypothetical protein